jgi:hypothetical protein
MAQNKNQARIDELNRNANRTPEEDKELANLQRNAGNPGTSDDSNSDR